MMRGMPREQVEANVERLRHGAKDEGIRELKLFFILQKIANDMNVDVDEAELNGRIAMLAAQRGRRPEKMKQEMSKEDRKSTRLNSSHANISYAVFCLKKKHRSCRHH